MDMKVGVSMWSYYNAWTQGRIDIAGFIHEAAQTGAQGVELLDFFYRDPGSDVPIVNLEAKRESALAALAEVGLECGVFSIAQNFVKEDAAERAAELQKILFGVDEALKFGSKVVRVFAGDVYGSTSFEDARGWIVDGLVDGANYAHERGIKLALENHGKLAGRGDQVRALIDDVRQRCGHDALGANPDTGNFLLVNQPSHEAIQEVAEYAYMVHFKDFLREPEGHEGFAYEALNGDRYVGTAVGEGEVNLEACVIALRDAGFKGWLNVEYEALEDPFTGVPRSVTAARGVINDVAMAK